MAGLELLTFAAGIVAGCLGAMLGIGGGVILVPLLNAVVGLEFKRAAAISLVGVLATSASVAAGPPPTRLNTRLALVLLMFSVLGATASASVLEHLTARQSELIFGVTAALIAFGMLLRLDRRNILTDAVDTGVLGGRFFDEDTRREVSYRIKRLPIALFVSSGAGAIASIVGVGGGILIVPALNAWCGVPMRVAAATSAFMIGITATPGAIAHYSAGWLGGYELAALSSLGVLVGFQLGSHAGAVAEVRWLKLLMAAVLALVAIEYLFLKTFL